MNKKEKWVVVLDDSDCTVGVGGEGYLHKVIQECSWNSSCWSLESVASPYSKSIFRDAADDEIENWVKNKTRANVPLNNKPKLYAGGMCNVNSIIDSVLFPK